MIGAGKVWFDNVNFEIVPNYINKTATNLNDPTSAEIIQEIMDNNPLGIPEKLPGNLDFEE